MNANGTGTDEAEIEWGDMDLAHFSPPRRLNCFYGQSRAKDRLRPFLREASDTDEPLPHFLLEGEPGLGKSLFVSIVAAELTDPLVVVDMSTMNPKRFSSFIRQFEGGILFADDLHRASAAQQALLLDLMREGHLSTPSGSKIYVEWITVAVATSEPTRIRSSVRGQFSLLSWSFRLMG